MMFAELARGRRNDSLGRCHPMMPPMMPGLINSIKVNKYVGVGARLFDLAYLLVASAPFPRFCPLSNNFNPAGES